MILMSFETYRAYSIEFMGYYWVGNQMFIYNNLILELI